MCCYVMAHLQTGIPCSVLFHNPCVAVLFCWANKPPMSCLQFVFTFSFLIILFSAFQMLFFRYKEIMLASYQFIRHSAACTARFGMLDWKLQVRSLGTPQQEPVADAALETLKNSKGVLVQTKKQNANLERFYRAQAVCASEAEFAAFFSAARRGLPSVFRVLRHRPEYKEGEAYFFSFLSHVPVRYIPK
jgi:hypothetical protein